MSSRKIILWDPNLDRPYNLKIYWGDYSFLIYYCSKINTAKTGTLMRLLRGESYYESAFELPRSGINQEMEEMTIQHNPTLLNEAIDFLNDEVIPSLNAQPEDMLFSVYGGKVALEDLMLRDEEHDCTWVLTTSDEYYSMEDGREYFVNLLIALCDYFEEMRDFGSDYKIYAKI